MMIKQLLGILTALTVAAAGLVISALDRSLFMTEPSEGRACAKT